MAVMKWEGGCERQSIQTSIFSTFGFNTDTATYGQTFTPSITAALKSFGFAINLPSTAKFKACLHAWGGTNAVGPALYTSSVTTTTTQPQVLTFTLTTCVTLQASTQYVVFLSSSGLWDGGAAITGNFYRVSGQNTNYGGSAVFDNNSNNFASLTTPAWTVYSSGVSFASSITYY